MKPILRWLGRGVYPAFLPGGHMAVYRGAETYLEDLWRDAPPMVALANTLLAAFVAVSPILVSGKPALLHRMPDSEQDAVLSKMMRSRVYFLRLVVYAVKGNALVAILRDDAARATFLPPSAGPERLSAP